MAYVDFDVDVIDSGEFPLVNYSHYAGITLPAAMETLQDILSQNIVRGLTMTEINPNNDRDGAMITRLVDGVVEAMSKRLR